LHVVDRLDSSRSHDAEEGSRHSETDDQERMTLERFEVSSPRYALRLGDRAGLSCVSRGASEFNQSSAFGVG
jgi:hypothetical protein